MMAFEKGSSAEGVKVSIAVQETGSDKKRQPPESKKDVSTKLSLESPLNELWARQGFRDKFCREMSVKYSKANSKHWPYLGEEFGIERDKIDEFASIDATSPSESMFLALERKKPSLRIVELRGALKKVKANKVFNIVQNAIEGKKISLNDLISDMWDKDPETVKQIILNLDKQCIWRDVAIELGFKRDACQSFERDMDPASNLTRDLFDVLRTQKPRMKVKDFKLKLEKIKQEKVKKILEDHNIADDEELRELSRKPDVMLCIEHALNDPQDNESTLWKLAGSFKKLDGLHIDVEMFRARGTDANPTLHLMEYVIARFDPTIKDLIDHLKNIDRLDICDVIIKYLEDAHQEKLPSDPASSPTSCAQATADQPLPEMVENREATEQL